MPSPHNAAVTWVNLADNAMMQASSFAPLMPPETLKNHHVGRKWRALSNSVRLIWDLQQVHLVDVVALFGLNLSSAATVRVQMSNSDPAAMSDLVYDSSPMSGAVDDRYKSMVHLLSSPVNVRYIGMDLSDSSVTYIEAGRHNIAKMFQFENNFAPGWGKSYADETRIKKSRGGQTYVDPGPSYRTLELSFEQITVAELDVLDEIDRVNGIKKDIHFITKADSANLNRDSIWGLVEGLSPVVQATIAEDAAGYIYSKSFKIGERL